MGVLIAAQNNIKKLDNKPANTILNKFLKIISKIYFF